MKNTNIVHQNISIYHKFPSLLLNIVTTTFNSRDAPQNASLCPASSSSRGCRCSFIVSPTFIKPDSKESKIVHNHSWWKLNSLTPKPTAPNQHADSTRKK